MGWNITRGANEVIELSVLLLDTTGSMAEADFPPSRLAAARDAAVQFVQRKRILYGTDRTAVVRFATAPSLVSAFGRHPFEVQGDLGGLTPSGGTNITAALREARRVLLAECQAFPSSSLRCVLLSDGEHTDGRSPQEDGIAADLQRAGVVADCVLIGRKGERLLREIAKQTGGEFAHCADFKQLLKKYDELALRKSRPARVLR